MKWKGRKAQVPDSFIIFNN